jgi:acetyltransferase-like isoleucine patch superfamily enzyme
MIKKFLTKVVLSLLSLKYNNFHPLVFTKGNLTVGKNVYVGLFSEVNATKGKIILGDDCDIASFVSINVADSHKKAIEKSSEIERGKIVFENNVFVGSHCFIGGDVYVGHHSVIAAGTILIGKGVVIPPYSLVVGNPYQVKEKYYDSAQ